MPLAPLIKFEKEKKNLPGKSNKSLGPTKTITSYHQYFLGITKKKGRKTKNLPRILTKTGKLIITKTNQPTGNGKKLIRERERRKKKKPLLPAALIVQMLTLHYYHPITIDQNWNASIVARNCRQWVHAVATIRNTSRPQDSTAVHVS
ncbi:hypothetical protein G9A89_010795 [Geosiphon pyriformis]|nr:hypothetical protein G9A89_010795 [Geosiphon pyriformis]